MQALREIRPRHRPTLIRLRAALPLRNPPDSLILAFMEHPSSIKRSVEPQSSPLFAVAAAPTSGPVDVYALVFVGPSSDALLAARRERNIGRTGVSVLWMVYRHIGGAGRRLRKCLFLLEGSGRCATVDRPERASPTGRFAPLVKVAVRPRGAGRAGSPKQTLACPVGSNEIVGSGGSEGESTARANRPLVALSSVRGGRGVMALAVGEPGESVLMPGSRPGEIGWL